MMSTQSSIQREESMRVTIAICTWNRSADLDKTLNEFPSLVIPEGIEWEILVVNNNCTDNTDEIIARHSTHLPIRRCFEPTPGHSSARNCAMAHATGDLIIWTDDDVLVDPKWVSEYVAAAQAWPEAQFFGGIIEPHFAEPPPTWIKRNIEILNGPFAIRDFGDEVRPLAPDEFIFGANMGFRRDTLLATRFDTSLGRVGNQLISGDDMAMVQKFRDRGLQGIWIGTSRVQHMIPLSRMQVAYSWRWFWGLGQSEIREHGIQPGRQILGVPFWLIRRLIATLPLSLIFAVSRNPRAFPTYHQLAIFLGMIHEIRLLRKQPTRQPQ